MNPIRGEYAGAARRSNGRNITRLLFDLIGFRVIEFLTHPNPIQMPKSPLRGQSPRIECLEQRIAPAAVTILTPTRAAFTDVTGSKVYIDVNKGTLTQANFVMAPAGLGYQLETLDLSKTDFGSEFEGVSVNITAHPSVTGGDNTVDVGWINATGIDLTNVRVHGDLGRINAGDTDLHTPAINEINVISMGLAGSTTQAPGGNLTSLISGGVREWTVFGDVVGATIQVADNNSLTPPPGDLNSHLSYIGHMDIMGSVIGGAAAGSGEVIAAGGFKTLHIGGDIIGGGGDNSGEIFTERSILNLIVGGSVQGDGGTDSGSVNAPLIRHTSIGGDLTGGAGNFSGAIMGVGNNLVDYGGEIMVHGSLTGGSGNNSGYIQGLNPVSVVIVGSINGGAGNDSGEIHTRRAESFTVDGSLTGGDGQNSGSIVVDNTFNTVHILRDMSGGSGAFSGTVHGLGGRIGYVAVSGSITGGSPNASNIAETGADSGSIISAQGGVLGVSVGGSVIGGGGNFSGSVVAAGSIGNVSVLGNLTAGSGTGTASVLGTASIASIAVTGDINGAATGVQFTGAANGLLNTLTVSGDIRVPVAMNLPVNTVLVRGSIDAGDTATGALVGTVINRMRVNGSILGSEANPVDILVSGAGAAAGTDALTLLRVNGGVMSANVLAGYAPDSTASVAPFKVVTPSARIDLVSVGGDWVASNLVAGVSPELMGYSAQRMM